MGHLRLSLVSVLYYAVVLLSIFLLEGVALLTNNLLGGFDNFLFFLIAIPTIVLLCYALINDHVINKTKIDVILSLCLAIIFISSTSMIFTAPNTTFTINGQIQLEVAFSFIDRLRYVIELGLGLFSIYILMFLLGRLQLRTKKILYLAWIFVLINGVLVICSLFLNFDIYKEIFNGDSSGVGVSSLFSNENAYGGSLLVTIFSLEMLNLYKKRWYHEVLIILFAFAIIFSSSATCIILTLCFLPIVFIFEIVRLFIKRWKLALFLTIVVLMGLTAIVILHNYLINHDVKWMVNFQKFIVEDCLDKNFKTLSGRTKIWDMAVDVLIQHPMQLFFGFGHGVSPYYINGYYSVFDGVVSDVTSLHNGFIEILFRFGVVGLLLYIFFIIYFLYCLLRLFIKKHFSVSIIHFVLFIFLIAYSFLESVYFFELNTIGLYIGFIVMLPPMISYKHISRPKLIKEAEVVDAWKEKIRPASLFKLLTAFITSLITLFASLLFIPSFYHQDTFDVVVEILKILVISLFLLPNLVSLLSLCQDRKIFKRKLFVISTIVVTISLSIFVPMYLIDKTKPYAFDTLNIVYLILLLFINIIYTIEHKEIKHYFKLLFKGIFVTPKLGLLFQIATYLIIYTLSSSFYEYTLLSAVSVGIIGFMMFVFGSLLLPFKESKTYLKYINNENLAYIKSIVYRYKI